MFQVMITELKLANVSPRTIDAYLYHHQKFIDFVRKKPQEVKTDDVKHYILHLMSRQAKTKTIRLVIAALNFYYAKILRRNIMKHIQRPKLEKTLPKTLEKVEILKMINSTYNLKHRLLIELLYSSGMRVGEAVKLRKEDINKEKRIAIVKAGKGKKDRFVILSQKFLKDYAKYELCVCDYVFKSEHNKLSHISIRTAEQIISDAARKAGIKQNVHPHMMRASFATHLLDNGTDIALISSLLGHSSVDTTRNCYIKAKTSHLEKIKSPLDD